MKKILLAGAVGMALSTAAQAATVTYADRASFATNLGASVTDDYSNPGYQFIQSNAAMSAVLGQTDYFTTGFSNLNIVNSQTYCAGCNGSFRLLFGTTSVTSGNGVYGVGLDIIYHDRSLPYTALVTFGDGGTTNFALPFPQGGPAFFGITSNRQIASIDFGPNGGQSTMSGSFTIDNLTIGAAGGVPEPSAWALMILGFGFAGTAMRARVRSVRFA